MKITYYGHSCFEISTSGKKFLVDPFITPNPQAKHIDINQVQPDYILISHGHQDHLADALQIANSTNAIIISNFEIATWYAKQCVKQTIGMNIGGVVTAENLNIRMTLAAHSSSLPDGTYAGLAAGFLIKDENQTIYYSGDTGLFAEIKFIGELYHPDLALLPIGGNFTMNAEDAALAAEFLNCKEVIGLHYDTFPPIQIDQELAKTIFKHKNINLTLLPIGNTYQVQYKQQHG